MAIRRIIHDIIKSKEVEVARRNETLELTNSKLIKALRRREKHLK